MHQTLCGELAIRGNDRALAAWKDFLIPWTNAYSDIPILEQTKAKFFPSLATRCLTRQNFFKRPLNPVDFFADNPDRLLIFRRVGQWSDSRHSASYLMISSQNEI